MTQVQLSLHDLSQLVVMQTQSGKSRDEVVKVLVARGWPEVSAVRFVTLTLTEQGARSARAQALEEDQQPTHQTFTSGQDAWHMLLVVVFIVAMLIACMLSVYVR